MFELFRSESNIKLVHFSVYLVVVVDVVVVVVVVVVVLVARRCRLVVVVADGRELSYPQNPVSGTLARRSRKVVDRHLETEVMMFAWPRL